MRGHGQDSHRLAAHALSVRPRNNKYTTTTTDNNKNTENNYYYYYYT